jgi:O-acetyl-ADP-ribose deacetylase (regulator of RNase III)
MTIHYVEGNLLKDNAQVLVNPVNCVGVMGKGLARQFKDAYPAMFEEYKSYCWNKWLQPGGIHIFLLEDEPERYIANFATKGHFRDKSRAYFIIRGLEELLKTVDDLNLSSVAIPALGCGEGGLEWPLVKEIIENKLRLYQDIDIRVYVPHGEK